MWLNEEFPNISARAAAEKAEIFFGDETGIQNSANYLRGYSPVGCTPVVRVESKKMRINLISAVSNRGKLHFLLYKDSMNSKRLIDFMKRLIKNALKEKGEDAKAKVFLILDNLKVHHSEEVTTWLKKRKSKIEVFFLPSYAPEYNPDELLNSDLKRSIGSRPMSRSEEDLERSTRSRLRHLRRNEHKVKSFFGGKYTKYAA